VITTLLESNSEDNNYVYDNERNGVDSIECSTPTRSNAL